MNKYLAISMISMFLLGSSLPGYAEFGRHGHGGYEKKMSKVLEQLPEEKAQLVKDTLKGMRESRKAMHEEMRKIKQSIKDTLVAESFDESAFIEQSMQIHNMRGQMMQNMAQTAANIAKELEPEQREILLKLMRPDKGRRP